MVARPEFGLTQLLAAGLLTSAAFSCAFACGPAAAAEDESESLEEEFLLFLSDWSDTAGEFVAPSEVEAIFTEKASQGHSEPEEHTRDGEAVEGGDTDD